MVFRMACNLEVVAERDSVGPAGTEHKVWIACTRVSYGGKRDIGELLNLAPSLGGRKRMDDLTELILQVL